MVSKSWFGLMEERKRTYTNVGDDMFEN